MISNSSVFKALRNLAYLFMLGFLVYYWFPFPPIVWRLGLVLVCVIGLLIHINQFPFSAVEKSLFCFILINASTFLVTFIWRTPFTTHFGNVLCSTLPLFLFFVLSAHGTITSKTLTILLLVSCVAGVFYFRHAESMILERVLSGDPGSFTINASTVFLVIVPLLFLVRNKRVTIGVSVLIVFFIIYGAKRGNIVSVVVPFYLLIRMNMKIHKSLMSEIVLILSVLAISFFAYYLMVNNDYLLSRIEKTIEGDSSNRDIIYAAALDTWLRAPTLFNTLFGFGADGTLVTIGIRAHNDWLEVLVDYGLVGVICYLSFFVYLLKVAIGNRDNPRFFYALLSVFFIWFSKTLYSMGYSNDIFSFLSMTIGVVLGYQYREKHGLPVY